MSDVIRQASAAHHYLVVFDDPTEEPLYLGRAKRLASTGQRIVLYARDRGCTFPGCTTPAYHSEVHHRTADWAVGGLTNIDDETLACSPDNRRVKPGGWSTRKLQDTAALRGITTGSGILGVPVGGFAPALPRRAGGLPAQRHNVRVRCGGRRRDPFGQSVAGRLGRNHNDGSANAPITALCPTHPSM